MIKEIREELDQLGEESYKQFNQKLIPRDRSCDRCSYAGSSKAGKRNCKNRFETVSGRSTDRNR